MRKLILLILLALITVPLLAEQLSLDDIILDIYNAAAELGETDYEQLQADLYALHDTPVDLNATSEEELSRLPFLSPQQIDDLLAYADRHPFESLYELRLIPSLTDYEIRDLLPFVTVRERKQNDTLYAREVFAKARHELITRLDIRNTEAFEGTDPVYAQLRYRFDYRRRVIFGLQLRRPAGGAAQDLQYGGYLQLRDIGHLHTLVAGTFQASFGQGLVLAPVFRTGKSAYVANAGMASQGLRYYSSVDGEGLQGVGATFRWEKTKSTWLDFSALYSLKRANDSTLHHLLGANLTFRHKQLSLQLTAVENLWSDSISPYRNTAYNSHYFRGRNQAVIGASARYNYGWFDLFGEVAAAQNMERWGVGTVIGSRFYPATGVSLVALYRYYSPHFDNALGYAFSETSRLGDENGAYIGFDITRLARWRWTGYADVFRFSGPKYGIPDFPSWGYDVMTQAQYHAPDAWWIAARLRAREKGNKSLFSARLQFDWEQAGWNLRTSAEANIGGLKSEQGALPYGVSVAQDVAYTFVNAPLSLRLRLQYFDAQNYDNRIYTYEHDVLYAYSIPAVYGLGGRAYLTLRWRIIRNLTLYFRVSETLYAKQWAVTHDRPVTRTDVHLLLRAVL